MSNDSSANSPQETVNQEPQPSYVKLAMRNMVRKRGQAMRHFFLSAVGVLALLIALSYLTR